MSEGYGETVGSQTGSTSGSASHLPWHLIPGFEPGETDLSEYTRRLEFLAGIWPSEHLCQLAPRAALQCKGSAFQKVVRISPEKLKVNDISGVKLLVSTLGGVWGKTTLEDKYEKFERAIYGISQRSDESNESYMARHEVVFEDMLSQGATLSDVRAYILLRNSALNAEDKKRVVIEAKGHLKYESVTAAIRMLGAKFFLEVQGTQKSHRNKTYDVNYVQDGVDDEILYSDDSNLIFAADASDVPDSIVEQFLAEGDEDALVVQQFEDALIDTMQNDTEMNAFMGKAAGKIQKPRLLANQVKRCRQEGEVQGFLTALPKASSHEDCREQLQALRPAWPLACRMSPTTTRSSSLEPTESSADQHDGLCQWCFR